MKRGWGSRPILEFEIRSAQAVSKSAGEAARKLNCSYNCYKKYAKLYGIFELLLNKPGKGKRKIYNPTGGKYPIQRIINGEFPNFPHDRIKDRLIQTGIKENKCEKCGFNESRFFDNKSPIVANFLDGNRTNHRLENIELLCYNCYHNNVGNLFGKQKKFTLPID